MFNILTFCSNTAATKRVRPQTILLLTLHWVIILIIQNDSIGDLTKNLSFLCRKYLKRNLVKAQPEIR